MKNNKRFKNLDRLKCDVDQDVLITIDFTPSTMYINLQVTVISDDGWCWALALRKLGVLIVYCIPLTDPDSVQLGSLSYYLDVLQAVPQLQDLNELISGHVCKISDVWIYFFSKIDSIITTRPVFLACRATFNNTFTLFQSKVCF